jgi:hypothetical protein
MKLLGAEVISVEIGMYLILPNTVSPTFQDLEL